MESTDESTEPREKPSALAAVALLLCIVIAIASRVLGPSDIYDNDQPGPIAHIVDVAVNDQWLMQRQPSGRLATKPPMYPWLGGLVVKATGRFDEWTFKLPIIAAFLVTTGLIYDLARRRLGVTLACLAAAFWVANYHVFKLLYTARTDMLVTMWIVLGLWCVQRMREHWRADAPSPVPPAFIGVFWLSIAAGALTKGPAAALPIVWLVLSVVLDRAWRRSRPAWQLAGLLVAAALVSAWLVPALQAYPTWRANINREVTDRVTGTGSGASRDTPMLAIPGYFFARFAPWSVLTAFACFELWRKRKDASHRPLLRQMPWAVWWVLLVLVAFMIPQGRRADYILPAYAGGAILAAWVVGEAARERGRWVLALASVAAIAVAIGLGVYQWRWSPAAKSVEGERILALVEEARSLAGGRPIATYEVGYTPVQALLGSNDPIDERMLTRIETGGVLITSREAWDPIAAPYAGRANVIRETPKLKESGVRLMLIDVSGAATER